MSETKLLTPQEVCVMLGIKSAETLRYLRRTGQLGF
jgi:hypothetical protein